MAPNLKFFLLFALFASILNQIAMARPLGHRSRSSSNLAARLKLDEGSASCWDSLMQLQACTGEIVTFFINGETYLGPSCCLAIRTTTDQCWPNLINTVGLTAEETDMLEGYCGKEGDADSNPEDVEVRGNRVSFP